MGAVPIGEFSELAVTRRTQSGVYLRGDPDDILLPTKYVPPATRIGDVLRVFVYTDSLDRPVATTLTPRAVVGEFACMTVIDAGPPGAFLDWGLEKDLLVPFREQATPMVKGRPYVVRVCLDARSGRVIATSRYRRFLSRDRRGVKPGLAMEVLVAERTPLGYTVILAGKYPGLLYHDQTQHPLEIGARLTGFIQRVRPDGLVDVTVKPPAAQALLEGKPLILARLEEAGGFLPFHDGSDPGEIERVFGMSKKVFKRIIGNLFKERRIMIEETGIRLP